MLSTNAGKGWFDLIATRHRPQEPKLKALVHAEEIEFVRAFDR
jgi:hypothetical protein